MYVVIFVTLISILLTYLDSRGVLKNGMFFGFVLVAILGSIRYNYGNDYIDYMTMFKEITSTPLKWSDLLNGIYQREPGWVLINYLFSHLGGFFVMIATISIVQNVIFYKFIKTNVQKSQWAIAMMVYLMSTSLYILSFSMIRQSLAISLFVFSWTFMRNKRIVPTLLVLGVASTIHYSAQILLPFALLPFIPLGKKMISVIFIVLTIALYANQELLADSFAAITAIEGLQSAQSLEFYTEHDNTTVTYGLGFIINLIPFIISMWALFTRENKIDDEKKLLITISMISFVIAPFAMILQLLARFTMYFNAYNVASIPFIYSLLPNKKLYTALMGIYLLMLIYGYFMFFHSEVWSYSYSTFHTIFEVL